ncbi:acyl carrier protein [Streptomyces europaeiscabiei]|uniref:Acyl carrier protein n=1 Tax=Streptomyces europaeiscabiei TaxID=146819 RepID=A0AAJ2ULZ5_9ACTN|nr:acyl carrier protein [Streptomyces europaeiscabiei]MDX3131221.1 acyl carrier protein [Streptomyces europaeiscabiei]
MNDSATAITPSTDFTASTHSDTYDLVRAALTSTFRIPEDELSPDVTLEQLELDSLALAELILVLEESLGVKADGELATRTTTLADVSAHLDELRASAGAAGR